MINNYTIRFLDRWLSSESERGSIQKSNTAECVKNLVQLQLECAGITSFNGMNACCEEYLKSKELNCKCNKIWSDIMDGLRNSSLNIICSIRKPLHINNNNDCLPKAKSYGDEMTLSDIDVDVQRLRRLNEFFVHLIPLQSKLKTKSSFSQGDFYTHLSEQLSELSDLDEIHEINIDHDKILYLDNSTINEVFLEFPYNRFLENVSATIEEFSSVTIPYGLGKYTGFKGMVEYIAIIMPILNNEMWRWDSISWTETGNLVDINIAEDGRTIQIKLRLKGSWMKSCLPYDEVMIIDVKYDNCCDKQFSNVSLLPNLGTNRWMKMFTSGLFLVDEFRPSRWICNYHDEYCKDGKQVYQSIDECIEYIENLPKMDPNCEKNLVASGHTSYCLLKHTFMLPISDSHCYHIAPHYVEVPDGTRRCDSALECNKYYEVGNGNLVYGYDNYIKEMEVIQNLPPGSLAIYDESTDQLIDYEFDQQQLECINNINEIFRIKTSLAENYVYYPNITK